MCVVPFLAQDAPSLKYLSHDVVCSSDRARRNSCAVCHGAVPVATLAAPARYTTQALVVAAFLSV